MKYVVLLLSFLIILTIPTVAQTKQTVPKDTKTADILGNARNTPGYVEVFVRKVEVEAEIESLLVEYTEEWMEVKIRRMELGLLEKELKKILAMKPEQMGKMSRAYGRLTVRKIELQAELIENTKKFGDDHPSVSKLKIKIDVYQREIDKLLK
jgi:hypothetical protein